MYIGKCKNMRTQRKRICICTYKQIPMTPKWLLLSDNSSGDFNFYVCPDVHFSKYPIRNVYCLPNHAKVIFMAVAKTTETTSRMQDWNSGSGMPSLAVGSLHPSAYLVAPLPTFLKSLMTSSLICERRTMTLFMKMSLRVAWSRLSRLVWCRTRYQQFTGESRYWSFLWKSRQLRLASLELSSRPCSMVSPWLLRPPSGPSRLSFILTHLQLGKWIP